MTNNYSVKVLKNGQLIQQRQIHSGLAQNTGAARLKAQADVVYVLGTDNAKKPVIKIISQRVGDDLQLILDGDPKSKPQLIIENYFAPDLNAAVATMGSTGELVMFAAENPHQAQSLLTPNQWVVQKAEGASEPWWGSTAVQLGLIGGGLFAVAEIRKKKSSNNSSASTPSSQDSVLTYASGNSGQASPPSETTYKDAGYTGVLFNNVNAINSAILRAQPKDKASTQNIINIYLKILNEANGNAPDATTDDPTFADYQALKINLTPFSNLGTSENSNKVLLLNDIIKNRNIGDVNLVSKIDALASTVDKLILMANDGLPTAALTTAELNAIGLTDVTDANVAAIRSAITASANDGSGIKTLSQLKSIQTAYLKVLAQADGIKANTTDTTKIPTLDELQSLGITLGKAGTTNDPQQASALQLLNDVIDGLNNAAVDTVAELTALATTIDKVMGVAKADTTETATALGLTVSGLSGLGLTGVTTDNLAQVTEAIRLTHASDGKKLSTLKQLQSAVDLGVIMQYAQSDLGTPGHIAPTLTQYQNAGVVSVDSGINKAITNVTAINSAVEALKAENVDTTGELQALVNTYTVLLNMADGIKGNTADSSRMKVEDYKRLGALTNYVSPTGAIDGTLSSKATNASDPQSAASLKLLNDVIDAKNSFQVDSIAEINALSILVDKLIDQASETPTATLSVADFSGSQGAFLGIQNVNDSNVSQVIEELKAASKNLSNGSAIDTLAEIQSLVSLAVVKMYADNSSNTLPTLQMYKDLNFSDVDWDTTLVSAVNTVVNSKTKNQIDLTGLQSIANAYENILAEATNGVSNSNPDPTVSIYETITGSKLHLFSVNDPTNDKLDDNALLLMNDIVQHKTPDQLNTQVEVDTLATQVDRLMKLASNKSAITFADLSSLGFTIPSGWSDYNTPNKINKFSQLVIAGADSGEDINSWDKVQNIINSSAVISA